MIGIDGQDGQTDRLLLIAYAANATNDDVPTLEEKSLSCLV